MSTYSVRYVHQIAPKDSDVGGDVTLRDGALADRKTLAAELRRTGVLGAGARVTGFRVEGDRVIVFPKMPGVTTYWHSVILTHQEPDAAPLDAALTAKEATILGGLREHVEAFEDTTELWGSVYIDNAKPGGMPPRSFAGVLAALERKGLYRSQGDDAFGYVRMPKADAR